MDWTDMLLAPQGVAPDYIIEEEIDWWVCKCGNTPGSDGFYPCDTSGTIVEPEPHLWDGKNYTCHRCWRIINQDTLEILGVCSDEVVNTNMKFQWQ